MRYFLLIIAWLVACAATPAPLEVALNIDSALAVLKAVRDPSLTRDQASVIARMPGNQGLIRKARSYNIPADEATLAEALLAAAQRRTGPANTYFHFDDVRDDADRIGKVLAELTDPASRALPDVKMRIAQFAPPDAKGAVTGYIVVGGNSGGFAFGEPAFF